MGFDWLKIGKKQPPPLGFPAAGAKASYEACLGGFRFAPVPPAIDIDF